MDKLIWKMTLPKEIPKKRTLQLRALKEKSLKISHLKRMVILVPAFCQLSMVFKMFFVKRKEEG